jgi:hypothetical protein
LSPPVDPQPLRPTAIKPVSLQLNSVIIFSRRRDCLAGRVHSVVHNLGAARDQHRILKQVIRRAVLLEYDDDELNRVGQCPAAVLAQEECGLRKSRG